MSPANWNLISLRFPLVCSFHISQNTYIFTRRQSAQFTHNFRCGRNVSPSLAALNRRATRLGGVDGLLPSLERGREPRTNNSRSVLDSFPRRVVPKCLAPRSPVDLRRTVSSGLLSKIERTLVIKVVPVRRRRNELNFQRSDVEDDDYPGISSTARGTTAWRCHQGCSSPDDDDNAPDSHPFLRCTGSVPEK